MLKSGAPRGVVTAIALLLALGVAHGADAQAAIRGITIGPIESS
ncbi:MAG TPA: hypothetical protein VFG30_07670 [Polyangiales bacterium]|nr:hypothetical protein [Polyangiales bacterium]